LSGFRELCTRLCADQGWELLPAGIRIPQPGGRSQLIGLETFSLEGRAMVRLVTTIGSADRLPPLRHAVALRLNAELAHGAFALRDGDLVMVETLALDGADAAGLESRIRYLAETADAQEERLFGADEY
jgi:hypothetical protein